MELIEPMPLLSKTELYILLPNLCRPSLPTCFRAYVDIWTADHDSWLPAIPGLIGTAWCFPKRSQYEYVSCQAFILLQLRLSHRLTHGKVSPQMQRPWENHPRCFSISTRSLVSSRMTSGYASKGTGFCALWIHSQHNLNQATVSFCTAVNSPCLDTKAIINAWRISQTVWQCLTFTRPLWHWSSWLLSHAGNVSHFHGRPHIDQELKGTEMALTNAYPVQRQSAGPTQCVSLIKIEALHLLSCRWVPGAFLPHEELPVHQPQSLEAWGRFSSLFRRNENGESLGLSWQHLESQHDLKLNGCPTSSNQSSATLYIQKLMSESLKQELFPVLNRKKL